MKAIAFRRNLVIALIILFAGAFTASTSETSDSQDVVTGVANPGAVPQLINYHDCPCANRDSLIIDEIRMPVPQKYLDCDGDGFLDLVRKEVDGEIYVFINKGSNENPLYREGILYEGGGN